jgi:endonuclease YncB( thermonuclease family)
MRNINMQNLGVMLKWSLSVFFLLIGTALVKTDTIAGIASLTIGFLTLPPLTAILRDYFNYSINKNIKVVSVIILFVVMCLTTTPSQETTTTKQLPNTIKESTNTATVNENKNKVTETSGTSQNQDAPKKVYYKVINVVDGDTIDISLGGKTERIRLIGIDTPETVDPRKPVQCFGKEASNKAKEILLNQEVTIEDDPTQGDTDKYSRYLRYVFLNDGTNFAQKMIAEGYGHEYTYNLPYKYQQDFKNAEKEAMTNKRGLWADNACPVEKPSSTPTPQNTPTPQKTQTTNTVIQNTSNQSSDNDANTSATKYTCDCKKTCSSMGCAEAQYQLNECGCTVRDRDKDGIACDENCQ